MRILGGLRQPDPIVHPPQRGRCPPVGPPGDPHERGHQDAAHQGRIEQDRERRTQAEQQAQLLRSQLEQQRMDWQSLNVRRKALADQLAEDNYDLHGVIATLPAEAIDSDWIVGDVSRIDGELHLTLRLPHGPNPSQAVAFPAPLTVLGDGPIPLPFDPKPEVIENPVVAEASV